jgi:hypothetical protein
MEIYNRRPIITRVSREKLNTNPDPIAELRMGRAAFAAAANHLEIAALSARSPHARHLARLSQLTAEVARPMGRLLRQMEREGVLSA